MWAGDGPVNGIEHLLHKPLHDWWWKIYIGQDQNGHQKRTECQRLLTSNVATKRGNFGHNTCFHTVTKPNLSFRWRHNIRGAREHTFDKFLGYTHNFRICSLSTKDKQITHDCRVHRQSTKVRQTESKDKKISQLYTATRTNNENTQWSSIPYQRGL